MRAAAPFMSGFVVYLLTISGSALLLRWFHKKMESAKYIAASALMVTAFIMIVAANATSKKEVQAMALLPESHFRANEPIGTASGLKPGRVVWVWNRNATNEKFTPTNDQNNWWAKHTNNDEVGKMLEMSLLMYSNENTLPKAWDALFKYFNEQQGKGAVGYKAGEKIYIKVNITNSASGMKKKNNFDRMDLTPELALNLLKHLIEEVGVAQSDIFIGDPFRNFHNLYWDMCHSVFPNVNYCDGLGIEGRHQTVPTAKHAMFFSDGKLRYRIPQEYVDADYFINIPCLKTHNEGGITVGAKNHQGSILADGQRSDNQYAIDMHYSLPANNLGYGKYRHLVDYLGHKDLGGKTLLTIIDGIWAGRSWEGFVEKWNMAPFNGDYPSSLFISQDRVAVDAVCYDFLLEEYKNKPTNRKYPYFEGCDDYLYQAADPSYWPEGLVYDPEGDGTPLKSLGVFEHWNNPTEMKYSKNLGTGNGIELVKINMNSDPLTPQNSGLVSSKVNKIFIDSFDVKWFGTDKGISRFDGANWTTIDISNYLKNNTVNDIVYEKSGYGDEIWVATNGGLSVMSYNVDGVTSATTYIVGGPGSGIISDTVTAVGLDKNHIRWIATPKGINTYGANGWNTTNTYLNYDREDKNWDGLIVNSIASYNNDGSVYMGTSGQGVIRMSYSEVDGFTGASAMSSVWSGLWSDTIHSVAIYDTVQWYGTNQGVFAHFGPSTKNYWDFAITPWDGIINNVVYDTEKDNNGNIWIGTEKGLFIMTQSSNISVNPSVSQANINWTAGKGIVSSLPDKKINDIQKDLLGTIWVATTTGVETFSSVPAATATDTKRVVFVTQSMNEPFIPSNGYTYIGKAEFGKGTAIGNWYCVYNGNGTTTDITGLTANSTYKVAVFDYSGQPGLEVYYYTESVNNQANFTTTIVGVDVFSTSNLKVYPIPFNDFLMLHFDESNDKSYKVTISNIDGKVFKKIVVDKNDRRIGTSELSKGIYLMRISDGETVKVIKIMK
jgi:hypothetical protein